MLEFSEYTIYGDGDVDWTDGETNETLESYCKSLSYRIDWDAYSEEDDMVCIVQVNQDICSGALFPGEEIKGMWLDEEDWKTGKNNTW